MPYVCSRDGHLIEYPEGDFCPDHGSRIFTNCQVCGEHWRVIASEDDPLEEQGAKFCVRCAHPAAWVSREERIGWLKDRLDDDQSLDPAERQNLRTILDELVEMEPDNSSALVGWDYLRKAAPGVWAMGQSILTSLIASSLRGSLGLS